VGLAETHLEADEDIGKFAGPAGYPRSVASSWTRRSCSVALLGPEEMRADPWQWSPALMGRVVSAILHTRGGDVLVIMVYLDVDNFGKRRQAMEEIAARMVTADLPTIILGDFNAEPHDEELQAVEQHADYAHELLDYEYKSTANRCIDFMMVKHIGVERFGTDTAIARPHVAMWCVFEAVRAMTFQAIHKFERMEPADAWDDAWTAQWQPVSPAFDAAILAKDVEKAWSTWCRAFELSCGVREPRRHSGTVVACKERVWQGRQGQRQTVVERRLHRVRRRLHQLRHEPSAASGTLVHRAKMGLAGLIREGIVQGNCEDFEGMMGVIDCKLEELSAEVKRRRLQAWREEQQEGHMRGVFRYLANKRLVAMKAVKGSGGKLTAEPQAIVAEAVKQWEKKQHYTLEEARWRRYVELVSADVERYDAPDGVAEAFTEKELRWACRATVGTAPGPTQVPAEILAKALVHALEMLAKLGDLIAETGEWPTALKMQEVTMIPKLKDGVPSDDLRPIGVTAVIARVLSKVLIKRYREWARKVQVTDAVWTLFEVDSVISEAVSADKGFIIRQSDLSNCFTRLQPELIVEMAVAFGMQRRHAVMLFMNNVARPTVIKVGGGLTSDWYEVTRGMAQGDPASPLAAAILAGAHARYLRRVTEGKVHFWTYVDDRAMIAESAEELDTAVEALQRLDALSGQMEDDGKLEVETVNIDGGGGRGYLDLLGVRLSLCGVHPPEVAPRVLRRNEVFMTRLRRLQAVRRAAALEPRRVQRVIACTAGLLRWDAPWAIMDMGVVKKMRKQMEVTIAGRKRHAAWRHRGAAWVAMDGGWTIEPYGVMMGGIVRTMARAVGTSVEATLRAAWRRPAAATWSDGFVTRARHVLELMKWQCTNDPFVFNFGRHQVDLRVIPAGRRDHLVREAWRAFMVREACRDAKRKVDMTTTSIDSEVFKKFLRGRTGANRTFAWRCAVAAEPNPERLHHTTPEVPQDCARCGVRADTFHMMWQCPLTESLRARHRLNLGVVDAAWHQAAGRMAWRCNGWRRADWEEAPCPVQRDMAQRILRFKLEVFTPWLEAHAGMRPYAG
jgi:hypothetical protein